MMKEFKMADILPVEALKSKIWSMFDILRTEAGIQGSGDYHVLLFLLSAYKDGLFNTEILNENSNLNEKLVRCLHNSESELTNQYNPIFATFEPLVKRLSENGTRHIIGALGELNLAILDEHFADIFDAVLYRITQTQGRFAGEFIQPVELTRFICGLAELQPNSKVYNPFAGLASFDIFLDQGHDYFGQELYQKTWSLGVLRIMANQRTGTSRYVCDDSISHWPASSEKFDLIVANPPYGMRFGNQYREIEPEFRTIEQFLLEKGVHSLNEKGKLIALLPQGILFRSLHEQRLREFLVDKDLIDTIISLPGGLLLNTGIPLIIMVLNKNKKIPGKVRFVDAKKFVDSKSPRERVLNDYGLNSFLHGCNNDSDILRLVSNNEIRAFDYNLSVPRYFQKQVEGVKLGEVIELVRGVRGNLPSIGKLIRIRDLKDDALEFQLNLNKIEETEIPRFAQQISESCLLLASRWKTLKPTYFNYTGSPIFITPDTLAFKVNESKCDLLFLISELHASYVMEQLDSLRTGSVIPTIRKEDLLSIIISIPGLDEQSLIRQKAIIKQRVVELAEEKKRELFLFNKIHGLENEIVEQNTYLRHTLAGPSSNLKDSISNIKKIILEKLIPDFPHLLDLKLSDKHLVTLGGYLSIIERDSDKIVTAVTSQLKVDTGIDNKKLFPIEIIDFLDKYTAEYNDRVGLNFKIDFDYDKEVFVDADGNRVKAFILANDELLRELFDNLIENAVKHAFNQELHNRIEIYLMKNTENEVQDDIQILFSNTGAPFPKGFSFNEFIRKGAKFGKSSGDGFGGWYINEIIKKLKGDFDIIDETGPEGLPGTDLATSFEINFPIIETEENV